MASFYIAYSSDSSDSDSDTKPATFPAYLRVPGIRPHHRGVALVRGSTCQTIMKLVTVHGDTAEQVLASEEWKEADEDGWTVAEVEAVIKECVRLGLNGRSKHEFAP